MNLADASGRLARWRLRLAEYDFDVTYVKGMKNRVADALSRIPSMGVTTVPIDEEIPCYSVMNFDDELQHQEETYDTTDVEISTGWYALDPITHEEFPREQHSDPFCKEVASRLEKGEASAELRPSRFFMNREGLLCRKAHLDGPSVCRY